MSEDNLPHESSFPVRLMAIRHAARGINIYEFAREDGLALAEAEPGAHIDVVLPNRMVRSYSLIAPGPAPERYVIAVKRDANSRGASSFLHDTIKVGQTVTVTGPRNNFRLDDSDAPVVLIVGGIGITPIWSMVQRLTQSPRVRRSWTLHYSCRARAEAAFLSDLQRFPQVRVNFDEESDHVLDIAAAVTAAPTDAHLYCCGPAPMLAAFETITSGWPALRKHVEYFAPKTEPVRLGGFIVELRRSGREFSIPAGKSILQVLREAGIDVAYSCEQGICGTCDTSIVSGIPDHRDSVLTLAEQATNKTVMICCAGSKTERLVLDL